MIELNGKKIANNIFLAPMAGFTEVAFRKICADFGAGLCCTEMVSAKALALGNEKTKELLETYENESCAVQLFGHEVDAFRMAIKSGVLDKFPIIDINMGCPVPKIYGSGEGSALLETPILAQELISVAAESGKAVTVKMRIPEKYTVSYFARAVEEAGAKLITVHARKRSEFYLGSPHYEAIKEAVSAVHIPVVANGNVTDKKSYDEFLGFTGAAGAMIGRAALQEPYIFAELSGADYDSDKLKIALKHIELLSGFYDEHKLVTSMRKILCFYLHGVRNGRRAKMRLCSCESKEELIRAVKEVFASET